MSHQPDFIANLIYAFLNNTLSEEQERDLKQWLQSSPSNAAYFTSVVEKIRSGELSREYLSSNDDSIWQKITDQVPELEISPTIVTPLRPNRWKKIAIAAAVIAVAATAGWFTFSNNNTDHSASLTANVTEDVMPGGDKAVLTLADGRRIILDTTRNGQTLMQESVKIIQTEKGKLEYKYTKGDREVAATMYNTITVPAGGRYRVELPDGSQVWLNAHSSLRYPVAFNASSRNVTLKGEGYFEVAPLYANDNKTRVPFNVAVQSLDGTPVSTIEVKGTHFNISAYDSVLRTTLTEGKVKVISQTGASAMLSPGQQAIQEGIKSLIVDPSADTEQVTAWVGGFFNFNNATIREIMEEAARWYSLQVVYQGENDKHFSLNLPRDLPISKLLQVLEMTGSIKFNINKNTNTITVQQ